MSQNKKIANNNKKESANRMNDKRLALKAVPRAGIEPAWVAPLVFETSASTYSAIWAFCVCKVNRFFSISNYIGHFFSKILCILWSKRAKSMGKRVVVPPHWAKSLC